MKKLIKLEGEYYLLGGEINKDDFVTLTIAHVQYVTKVDSVEENGYIITEVGGLCHPNTNPRKILASTVSLEGAKMLNRKQIENFLASKTLDLDKLVYGKTAKEGIYRTEANEGVKHGYSRALLDNADKRWTDEDLKKAYVQGGFDSNAMAKKLHKEIKTYNSPEDYLFSLTSEWEVEIEYEKPSSSFGAHLANFVGEKIPKITDGYINILKIK